MRVILLSIDLYFLSSHLNKCHLRDVLLSTHSRLHRRYEGWPILLFEVGVALQYLVLDTKLSGVGINYSYIIDESQGEF